MTAPARILVRGVNWLGDAVMTTPALLRLREARRQDWICLLTPEKLEGLWQDHPAVNEVIAFSPRDSLWRVAGKLRAGRFQMALVLPNSMRSALEVWLAGIPRRVGYARSGRGWLLNERLSESAGTVSMRKRTEVEINRALEGKSPYPAIPAASHQLFHYLRLVETLGGNPRAVAPSIAVSAPETQAFAAKYLPFEDPANPSLWLGLNAGAEYGPAKRWPVERFVAAAVSLHRQTHCRWLVFGGPGEGEFGRRLADEINATASNSSRPICGNSKPIAVSVAGQTTLRELCAGLRWCRVLLTNDSGPMHVAAAVGTPVVVPFGSTSPELTGPGLPGDARHRLLRASVACAPCFQRVCPIDFRCMLNLDVERVVTAVLSAVN